MSGGWIKLHRALLDHPIFTCSTPEQIKILLTILMMVNHKPNRWVFEGEKYDVKAGEMITSLDSIHKKCGKGISIKNIRTALKKFENLDFLANKSAKTGRLISIINWEAYQVGWQTGGNEDGKQVADDWQTGGKQVASNKEGKNDKNEKNVRNKYTDSFESFWKQYPKKKEKTKAFAAFKVLRPDQELLNTMMSALSKQKESNDWKKEGGKYIVYPERWIKNHRWEDEVSQSSEPETVWDKNKAAGMAFLAEQNK